MTDDASPEVPPRLEAARSELLDHATPNDPAIAEDLASRARAASRVDLGLDARLEAYEDLLESEVGDTSLSRARNIERHAGFRQLYLKFEGGNPTGTQKDRIAFSQVADALRRGFDTITVATCGNYGAAVSLAASLAGLKPVIYLPESYRSKRVTEMAERGADIVRTPGGYERAVALSMERARRDRLYDANPGGANTPIQLAAYGQIAYEIYDELRDAPAAVAVPVSNGTTLAGIYRGFVGLHRRGKTSRIPRMIAASSFHKNPIVRAYRVGAPRCLDLHPHAVRESQVNEPLVNWRSLDGDAALAAVRASGGIAVDVTDRRMCACARSLKTQEGLSVLPASTAGLLALLDCHSKDGLRNDRYVAVVTGRNG